MGNARWMTTRAFAWSRSVALEDRLNAVEAMMLQVVVGDHEVDRAPVAEAEAGRAVGGDFEEASPAGSGSRGGLPRGGAVGTRGKFRFDFDRALDGLGVAEDVVTFEGQAGVWREFEEALGFLRGESLGQAVLPCEVVEPEVERGLGGAGVPALAVVGWLCSEEAAEEADVLGPFGPWVGGATEALLGEVMDAAAFGIHAVGIFLPPEEAEQARVRQRIVGHDRREFVEVDLGDEAGVDGFVVGPGEAGGKVRCAAEAGRAQRAFAACEGVADARACDFEDVARAIGEAGLGESLAEAACCVGVHDKVIERSWAEDAKFRDLGP